MARAIRPVAALQSGADQILNAQIDQGIDLQEKLETVARHYLSRAMEKTGGNKRKAARLVGLASPQTLSNWLEKYGVR